MAEDEIGGNNENGTIRVRNIRSDRSFSRDLNVQRLNINTGEQKDAGSEMMSEVNDSVTDQTTTLEAALKEIQRQGAEQVKEIRQLGKELGLSPELVDTMKRGLHDGMREAMKEFGLTKDQINTTIPSSSDSIVDGDTKSLSDSMDALRQAIVALATQESGGGSDGDPSSGGRSEGGAAAQSRMFGSVADVVDDLIKDYPVMAALQREHNSQLSNLVRSGVYETLRGNLIDLGRTMQDTTNSLVSMATLREEGVKKFSSAVDIATTGVNSFSDIMFDFMPGFLRNGDNLKDTFELVRNSMEGDLINPIGLMGDDLLGVSESLYSARETLRGMDNDVVDRLSFRDLNSTMQMLYDLQRRQAVFSDLNSTIEKRRISEQLNFAQLIATNTGRTAEEIIKMNRQQAVDLANLSAAGGLTNAESSSFARAIQLFQGNGQNGLAELLHGVAMSGGSVEAYLSNNSELANDPAFVNQIGLIRQIVATARSGGDGAGFAEMLSQMSVGLGSNTHTGIAGAMSSSDLMRRIAGEAGRGDRSFRETQDDYFLEKGRGIQETIANNLGDGKLLTAIIANTVALGANTLALVGRGGLGGLLRGAGGMIGGAARMGGRALSSLRGAAMGATMMGTLGMQSMANSGAGRAVGSAARGGANMARMAGRSLIKKIPVIGLLASLGFGASRALAGDWSGAGLEVMSGAAGTIPGLGTAASVGIDATLAARDMGAFESGIDEGTASTPIRAPQTVGPSTSTNVTANRGIRTTTHQLIMNTNDLLETLIELAREDASIQKTIQQNTAKQPPEIPLTFWEKAFGRDDPPEPTAYSGAPN